MEASHNPPEDSIDKAIRKLQEQYAQLGLEIENLDEQMEELRKKRSETASQQCDVLQQLRMFEQAEPDQVTEVDGVVSVEPKKALPDIEFTYWRDAPITVLSLSTIEGLGLKKRRSLLEEIPTLGALEDLRTTASIRCQPLDAVMPKGIGKNTVDTIEERFLNWLDKNRGSYGVETVSSPATEPLPVQIDGTSAASKVFKSIVVESNEPSCATPQAQVPPDDLDASLEAIKASDMADADANAEAANEPDCEQCVDTLDASDPSVRVYDPNANRRGRPKGSLDKRPRAKRKVSEDSAPSSESSRPGPTPIEPEPNTEPNTEPTAVQASGVLADVDISTVNYSEEFMFPEDTIEYVRYRYRRLKSMGDQSTIVHDDRIFQGGLEAARRGWSLRDCSWAPGENQDDWILGFIHGNGAPVGESDSQLDSRVG